MSPEKLLEREKRMTKAKEIQSEMRQLSDLAKKEERDFSDDEKERFDKMLGEFNKFVSEEKREATLEELDKYTRENQAILDQMRDDDGQGAEVRFENIGEFFREIAALKGVVPGTEKRDILIGSGATGGNLVPSQFMDTILKVDPATSVVRPRATVIPAGDPPDAPFEIPYFDQSTDFTPSKRGESDTMSEGSPEFGLLTLTPVELSIFIDVSKKAMNNITSLSAFLENMFRTRNNAKEDTLFLTGDGTDGPKGVLNADCKIGVSRDTSSQIKFADVAAMMSSQLDFGKAFWIINQQAIPQVAAIADANGNSIFIQGNLAQNLPPSLMGAPIVWSPRISALGTEGDIMFVNLDYYLIKDGSGPAVEMYDVTPKTRMLTFTSVHNVDGDTWLKAAITREDGNTYSPVVTLEA